MSEYILRGEAMEFAFEEVKQGVWPNSLYQLKWMQEEYARLAKEGRRHVISDSGLTVTDQFEAIISDAKASVAREMRAKHEAQQLELHIAGQMSAAHAMPIEGSQQLPIVVDDSDESDSEDTEICTPSPVLIDLFCRDDETMVTPPPFLPQYRTAYAPDSPTVVPESPLTLPEPPILTAIPPTTAIATTATRPMVRDLLTVEAIEAGHKAISDVSGLSVGFVKTMWMLAVEEHMRIEARKQRIAVTSDFLRTCVNMFLRRQYVSGDTWCTACNSPFYNCSPMGGKFTCRHCSECALMCNTGNPNACVQFKNL